MSIPARAVLSTRALNRALLARQGLLEPRGVSALEVVEQLVGLQAQDVKAPYYQLFTRIQGFDPEELSALLAERRVVRIALMRGTIHLVSARDALALRPVVQEVLDRATAGTWGARLRGADPVAVGAAGRALVEEEPRTFQQLGALLAPRWPEADPAALAQTVRAQIPLVQVPPRGRWGMSGPAAHTSAEAWLEAGALAADLAALRADAIRRYLAAFGPASVGDIQKWSGLTRLAGDVERLRGELVSFSDAEGRELLDLPGAPRPGPDVDVPPVLLLGPFDNMLLSHVDTTRLLPAEHRRGVMTINGLVSGTFLLDGFVAGLWKAVTARGSARLHVTPLRRITRKEEAAVRREGARLLAFAAPGAASRDVVFGG